MADRSRRDGPLHAWWERCRGPLLRLAALLVAVALPVLVPAMPASADTSGQLTPTFSCAAANGDGTFTYFFGYASEDTQVENVPIGPDNQFTAGSKDQGQPTVYSPGSHPSAFSVTTSSSSLSWHLDKSKVTASTRSLCSNVPVLGEAPTAFVLPLATVAPLGIWFVLARRRARRRHYASG